VVGSRDAGRGRGTHCGTAWECRNYALAGQGAPGLTVGEWKQTQAPRMDRDVADLIENRKIPVYVVEEDLAERGTANDELVSGVKLVSRRALPGLFAEYEIISHW
jgi:hypothetical protein